MESCVNHKNNKAIYRCKTCNSPICSLCFNSLQTKQGKTKIGFCSHECYQKHLDNLEAERRKNFSKFTREVTYGLFLIFGAVSIFYFNSEKIYNIKDMNDLIMYLFLIAALGGWGLFRLLNILIEFKSGFPFPDKNGLGIKTTDENELIENRAKNSEDSRSSDLSKSLSIIDINDTSNATKFETPRIICHDSQLPDIIKGIKEFESLMQGHPERKSIKVMVDIHKNNHTFLLEFLPAIHPYMFYNILDYFDSSRTIGFMSGRDANYMFKNDQSEEFVTAVNDKGEGLTISKVDGTISKTSSAGFNYLNLSLNHEKFRKIESIEIILEDIGDFGISKLFNKKY